MKNRIGQLHRSLVLTVALILMLALSLASAWAQPAAPESAAATTHVIHFQGRLLSPGTGAPKPDAVYPVTFSLYNVSSGGNALWSETKNVQSVNGLFSTLLGDTTALVLGNFNGQDLWLGIKVGSDLEAAPRQRIAYAPYALFATTAGNAATLGGSAPNAFAAASHTHAGSAITSGTVAEARIDPLLARDSEVVPLVTGSGAFAPVNHTHAGSAITSGTVAEARIDPLLARDGEVGTLAAASGLMAAKDHNHLGETWSGTNSALKIEGSYGAAPLIVNNTGYGSAVLATSSGSAVMASSSNADGVQISSAADDGVQVTQANYGIYVANAAIQGLLVGNAGANGVQISTAAGDGVHIVQTGAPSAQPISSAANNGVEIERAQGSGVFVGRTEGDGVHVESGGYNAGYFKTEVLNGNGVAGIANSGTLAYGVYGSSANGYAGYFYGKVHVSGTLTKGAGAFKIDHPLDPANKFLYHSFVESPDMKNIYDGVATLDNNGEAVVQLPDWFEALNRDFRYQLTCIGGYAPVYIAQEINGNQFRIAGGSPGLKVSWQVTGIRHDPYAEANRIPVEEAKTPDEQGRYLFPSGYASPEAAAALSLDKPIPVEPVIVKPADAGPESVNGKP